MSKRREDTLDRAGHQTRTKRGSTRNNMLISAAEVMRERGAAGVTIDEVLARSGAPRGSVYYHFPEGRNQILTEALRWAGDSIADSIDCRCRSRRAAARPRIYRVLGAHAAGERFRRGLPRRRGSNRLHERRGRAGRSSRAISSGAGVTRCPALSSPTTSTPPRPSPWQSPASRRWKAPWCCAAHPQRRAAAPGRQPDGIPHQVTGIRSSQRSSDRRPLTLSPTRADEVAVDTGLHQRPFRAQGQQPPARPERARRVADDHFVDQPRGCELCGRISAADHPDVLIARRRTSCGCNSVTSPCRPHRIAGPRRCPGGGSAPRWAACTATRGSLARIHS